MVSSCLKLSVHIIAQSQMLHHSSCNKNSLEWQRTYASLVKKMEFCHQSSGLTLFWTGVGFFFRSKQVVNCITANKQVFQTVIKATQRSGEKHPIKYLPIDLIHKWRLINYSFVFRLIILTSLTLKQKFFWILFVQTRLVRMISIKTKE